MQIAVTSFLDELYGLLGQGPHLITLYEQKDISFVSSLKSWLEESESVLEKYHRPQVSEIAGIRAQLLSASNGVYERNVFHLPSSGGSRKIFHAIAAILFNNAQNILNNLFSTFSTYKEEAEKYIRQIILISLQKNSFYPIWHSDFGISERLNSLWQSFVADKDIVQGTRQILSSVNYADALRIMDEIITEWKL
ncbi:MAG: hypothetical protein WCE94_11740 [Candidatus Methanoperedens sp.]